MSVSLVTRTTQTPTNSDGSNNVTIGVNYTAGNCLVLVTGYNHATYGTVTVSDTHSNTWTETGSSPQSDAALLTVHTFVAPNMSGSSTTVTVSYGGSVKAAITVSEWSGVATSSVVTGTAGGKLLSGTSLDISSGSLSASGLSGDAVIAGYTNYYNPTWSAGATNPSGFAVDSGSTTGGGDGIGNIGMGYAILGSTYSGAATINPGTTDYGAIIAFVLKQGSGGGGGGNLTLGWLPMIQANEGQGWLVVTQGMTPPEI